MNAWFGSKTNTAHAVLQILLVIDDPADERPLRRLMSEACDQQSFVLHHLTRVGPDISEVDLAELDVALIDLTLPHGQGRQAIQQLREMAANLPIVALCRGGDANIGSDALNNGADDYLFKGEFDCQDLIRSLRYAIDRAGRRIAEREVRAARAIQQRLFPRRPPEIPGFDLAGACFPALAAGGDYFDFFPMFGDTQGLVIADVSGHGMGAAMVMSEVRAVLRTLATTYGDVGYILTRAGRLLAKDLPPEQFITVFLGRLNPRTRTLTYASAGHDGHVLDGHGRHRLTLDATAPPLNVDPDWDEVPSAEPIPLRPRDSLLLFTDGASECRAPEDGAQFGSRRVLEIVRLFIHETADQIIYNLYHSARAFAQYRPQDDDITALVAKLTA